MAVYSRKSVYTGKGESIENQIEMCKQYIFTKIRDVTEQSITVYEDEGFSAKNTDRPQFQRLIRDIRQRKYKYVVCYRLDRISRNVSDFAALIEDLNNMGVSFICVKEEFDTSKPMGKAMMFIASVFAQLERETIAERVRDNMFMLARTGRWLGGTAPTGFKSERIEQVNIDGRVKTACNLKFNHDEIGIVKMIFDRFIELQSLSGVSKYLIANNIKTRTGKYFSLLSIRDILSNPVYCTADVDAREYFMSRDSDVCFKEEDCSDKFGLLSYNKRDYKKKHAPRQAPSEWIVAIGKHEGIVTGRQWVDIQKTLDGNKPVGNAVKMHNDYSLLSGMLYCSKCGQKMFAKVRNNSGGLFDYICNNKLRGGRKLCACQNLSGQQADDMVYNYTLKLTSASPSSTKHLEKLKWDIQNQEKTDETGGIDARINRCNYEMDNLVNSLARLGSEGTLVQRVNAKVSALDEELERLIVERERLQLNHHQIPDDEIQPDTFRGFNNLTFWEKRRLVRLLVQRIEWDGSDAHIYIYDVAL